MEKQEQIHKRTITNQDDEMTNKKQDRKTKQKNREEPRRGK